MAVSSMKSPPSTDIVSDLLRRSFSVRPKCHRKAAPNEKFTIIIKEDRFPESLVRKKGLALWHFYLKEIFLLAESLTLSWKITWTIVNRK